MINVIGADFMNELDFRGNSPNIMRNLIYFCLITAEAAILFMEAVISSIAEEVSEIPAL